MKRIRLFFTRPVFFVRRQLQQYPRKVKILGGPLLGGLAGIAGGIPCIIIGIVLGYFLGEILSQSRRDNTIISYLTNPGSQQFPESQPGLAAWCALAVIIISKDMSEYSVEYSVEESRHNPPSFEMILKQVILGASYIFSGHQVDFLQTEHFTRLAWADRSNLNPDLLAESLAAKRLHLGDAPQLARCLYILAEGKNAKDLAGEIRLILDPAWNEAKEINDRGNDCRTDPWKILGLAPGTSQSEVKAHYRRLAKQFHPDEFQVFDERQQETVAKAFMTIKEAYRSISGGNQ